MYLDIDFYQFQKRFSTEKRCVNYLIKKRWTAGFVCSKCQSTEGYFIQSRSIYQCKACRHQVSVTAGTVFHKTRTPLRKWFWMIFFLTQSKHSYSVAGLQRLLKINSYNAAWSMAQKIRKAMADRDAQYQLAGIVEMDDSYFGAQRVKGKRGRGAAKKSKVVVSVQVNEGDKPIFAKMNVVHAVDRENITKTATDKIQKGSTVKTDAYPACNAL